MSRTPFLTLVVALVASPLVAAPKMDCSIRPPKGTAKADLPGLAKVSQADAQKAALLAKGIPAGASVAEAEQEEREGPLLGLREPEEGGRGEGQGRPLE